MTRRGIPKASLLLLSFGMLPAGLHAAFAPRSFYDDFPLGRGWIANDGPYNEHLIRDVGALFLALIVVTVWTVLRNGSLRPIAAAWVVKGVLHAVYHGRHLDGLTTADKVGLMASLVLVPVLAVIALTVETTNERKVSS